MRHTDEAQRLVDRAGALKRPCDLDLLLFFARHPQSMLASESIAGFLGYGLQDIAESLDLLLAAGLLTRTQTSAHAARLYVFTADTTSGDWLPSLLRTASSREGRGALMTALRARRTAQGGGSRARLEAKAPARVRRE